MDNERVTRPPTPHEPNLDGVPFAPIRKRQQRRALDVLVMAFTADPVIRWLYPEARQYLTHFPKFLAAFGGKAFEQRTAWRLGDFSAVALWLPPRVDPDGDAIVAVLTKTVGPVDEDHLPAYLESPNPRNISFYERHGFEVTGQAQAGACPPIVFMLRAAR